MKHYFYILFLLLISCSSNDESKNIAQIDVNSTPIHSPAISDIRYIPLETNKESLVSNVGKILFQNEKIYVFDKIVQNSITVFNSQGKFLYKIKRNGNGPGEYVRPIDFDVASNGDVYVWDNAKRRLTSYFNEGQDFKTIPVRENISFMNFSVLGNNMVLSQVFNKGKVIYNTLLYDKNNRELGENIEPRDYMDDPSLANYSFTRLYKSGKNINFYKRFTGEIYQTDGRVIKQVLNLNTEDLPNENFVKKALQDYNTLLADEKYIKDVVNIYENNEVLTFEVKQLRNKRLIYFISKTGKRAIRSPKILNNNFFADGSIHGSNGNQFYSVLHPTAVAKTKVAFEKKLEESTLSDSVKTTLRSIDGNSNPVIVLFNIQRF